VERIVTIIGVAAIAAVLAATGYMLVFNPVQARRTDLTARLDQIQSYEVEFKSPDWNYEAWHGSLAAKPALWTELIEPPPPTPPPPPPPPNLKKMAAGITVGRQAVGDKAKFFAPGDSRGTYLGVGDTIQGLTIKEVTRKQVTLSLRWKKQELTITLPRG